MQTLEIKVPDSKIARVKELLKELGVSVKVKNPSPSGDTWFLDSGNIAEMEQGRTDVNAGKVNERSLAEVKAMLGIINDR